MHGLLASQSCYHSALPPTGTGVTVGLVEVVTVKCTYVYSITKLDQSSLDLENNEDDD